MGSWISGNQPLINKSEFSYEWYSTIGTRGPGGHMY